MRQYLVTFLDGRTETVNAASLDEVEILYTGYPVVSINPLYTAQATALNPLWVLLLIAGLLWASRKA